MNTAYMFTASIFALDAVLVRNITSKYLAKAYASPILNNYKQNYSAIEKNNN